MPHAGAHRHVPTFGVSSSVSSREDAAGVTAGAPLWCTEHMSKHPDSLHTLSPRRRHATASALPSLDHDACDTEPVSCASNPHAPSPHTTLGVDASDVVASSYTRVSPSAVPSANRLDPR